MKTKKWMLNTMLIAGITACSYEETPLQEKASNGLMTITALTPSSDSRVALSDNGETEISVNWKSGDQISLMHYNTTPPGENITYTFVDGSNGKFTGEQHTNTGGSYYAIYPANTNLPIPQIVLDYSNQTGKLDESKTFMYAQSPELTSTTQLAFEHLSAILKPKFTFEGKDISSTLKTIQVTLPDNFNTQLAYNLIDGSVRMNQSSYNFIKISNDVTNPSKEEASNLYIYLPGGLFASGHKLIIGALDTDSVRYEGTITLTKDIVAGKVYTGTVALEKHAEKYANTNLQTWTAETKMTSLIRGNGTEKDPYLIETAADLQFLVLYAHIANTHYRLVNDLIIDSNENGPWTPIGTENPSKQYCRCIFDGNNKTISGKIVIKPNTTKSNYYFSYGLFGYLYGGIIKNLNVNADVTTLPTNDMAIYLGGIVGRMNGNGSTIENCTFDGSATIGNVLNTELPNSKTSYWLGGIVGHVNPVSVVKDCTNKGNLSGSIVDHVSIGGIVGQFSKCEMTGCSNSGTLPENIQGTQNTFIGTIVGNNWGTICTCCTDTSNSTLPTIGNGNEQEQVSGCTNH